MARHTKKQIAAYHIEQGLKRREIQYAKKAELQELGFKVAHNGDVFYKGKPLYKPHYIHIAFSVERFLKKRGIYAYKIMEKLNSSNRHLHRLVYTLTTFSFVRIIKWRKQYNVFRDWTMKILPIPSVDGRQTYMKVFADSTDLICWSVQNDVDEAFSYEDYALFHEDKELLLPQRIRFQRKVK